MAAGKSSGGGERMVALLRGINVSGAKRVPMAELRALAEGLGWRDVQTYIQSGNLVFRAAVTPAKAEAALEAAIEAHFGFAVPVIVRTAAAWAKVAADNPFAEVADERPNLVHVGFAKAKAKAGAAAALAGYCKAGERVVVRGDALWVDFPNGVARSKLMPAVLDRCLGSSVTMRNVRSLRAIADLLAVPGGAASDRDRGIGRAPAARSRRRT